MSPVLWQNSCEVRAVSVNESFPLDSPRDRAWVSTAADPLYFYLLGAASVFPGVAFSRFRRFVRVFQLLFHDDVLAVLLGTVGKNVRSRADHFVVVEISDVVLLAKSQFAST